MLPIPVKRCSCKELKRNSSQLYLLSEHGDLYFLLETVTNHYIEGNNQGKFKKNYVNFFFLRNHLKMFDAAAQAERLHVLHQKKTSIIHPVSVDFSKATMQIGALLNH